jgi:hypothetical protein
MKLRVGNNFSKKRVFIVVVVILVLYFAFVGFSNDEEAPIIGLNDLPSLFASRPTFRPRPPVILKTNDKSDDKSDDASPHSFPTPLRKLQPALDALTAHQLESALRCHEADATSKAETTRLSLPYLLYRCNGFCGGLGDRVRGVLTTFYMALVTGRCFGTQWEHPVPISQYFHIPRYEHAADCRSDTCSKRDLTHIDHWEPLRADIAKMHNMKGMLY